MVPLKLTLGCGLYDRTIPLADGGVVAEGLDLDFTPLRPNELFRRMLHDEEFDAAEMSLSAFILGLSRGDRRFVGIPVFPSRVMRHSYVFVNRSAGIAVPQDLRGKRVGVPEYHMTAALFIRGFLSDDYGVLPAEMTWYQGGQQRPGRQERVELRLPGDLSLEVVEDRALDDMLEAGEIDALVTARVPSSFLRRSAQVGRLFPDPKRVEIAWVRRTGIFPIMHLVVIRREVYERHPEVAPSLFDAFQQAKDVIAETFDGRGAAHSILPMFQLHLEEMNSVFGPDLCPYGVETNRATLDAALRYSHEQGLSERIVGLEELFAPNSLSAP